MTATSSKLGADMTYSDDFLAWLKKDECRLYMSPLDAQYAAWRAAIESRADARQPAAIDNEAAGYTEQFDVDELKRGGVMRVFAAHETDHDIPVYLTTPLEKESNQPVEPKATITRQQFDAMRVALEVIAVGDSKTPSYTAAHGLVASGFWTDALETENSNSRAASTSANVAQLDMSLEARLADAEADVKRLHAEKMELWNQVHGYSANVAQGSEAVAWFTDDSQSDKSATTWDRNVAERWRTKGWPVSPLYAAPPAQTALTDDARECLLDVTTHFDNLRAGLCAQRSEATNSDDGDSIAYWNREIRVLERMKAQAERALTAAQSASGDAK